MKTLDNENFNRRNGYLAVSLCFLVMSVSCFLSPPEMRPSGGRWGWLFGLLWDHLGRLGEFYYWLALTVVCFACFLRTKE